jgi:hypothetical protein
MRIVERLADGSRNLLASFPAYSAPRRKAMEAIQKLLANEAAILEQLATPTAVLVEAARAEQIASDAVLEQIAQPIAPPAPIESVGAIEIDMTPAAEQPAPQVPDGDHLVVIDEVRPGVTRSGDERWALRLRVAEGPFFGRQAAWDSLVFSTRGRARARLVLRALGFTEPKLVIEPKDLVGRRAMATIRNVTYATPDGTEVRRGEVPYDGYRAVGGAS